MALPFIVMMMVMMLVTVVVLMLMFVFMAFAMLMMMLMMVVLMALTFMLMFVIFHSSLLFFTVQRYIGPCATGLQMLRTHASTTARVAMEMRTEGPSASRTA